MYYDGHSDAWRAREDGPVNMKRLLRALLLVGIGIPVYAQAAPPAPPDKGPIDFRCDGMRIETKPKNRTFCERNVVLQRGTLLMCCDLFTGESDPKWVWRRFTCHGDVRALRNGEYMWGDDALFVVASDELVLTGHPLLQRGESVVGGEEIVVQVNQDRAQIHRPKGLLQVRESTAKGGTPAPAPVVLPDPLSELMKKFGGVLPARCPLPAAPKSR